jgi:hypothetical protein
MWKFSITGVQNEWQHGIWCGMDHIYRKQKQAHWGYSYKYCKLLKLDMCILQYTCMYILNTETLKVGSPSSTGTHWPEIAAYDWLQSGCRVSSLQLHPVHFSRLPLFSSPDLSQFHYDVISLNLHYKNKYHWLSQKTLKLSWNQYRHYPRNSNVYEVLTVVLTKNLSSGI